jgi:hypothetical protein
MSEHMPDRMPEKMPEGMSMPNRVQVMTEKYRE